MGAENILPQKGVKATLCGEEKLLRFNMKSMATLSEKYGTMTGVLKVVRDISERTEKDFTEKELIALADLISASLIWSDKTITTEYISNTYQLCDLVDILPFVLEAFVSSINNSSSGDSGDPLKA